MSQHRERIQFTGRVQGVFFRATSVEISRDRPLTGYVRNLADGSVEMEVQGDGAAVDDFVAAVNDRFAGHIVACNRRRVDVVQGEFRFVIRY